MKRLTRGEIEDRLFVALTRLPKATIAQLRSTDSVARETARREVAAELAAKLDGESFAVVMADMVAPHGIAMSPGKWGIDEPAPGTIVMVPRMDLGKDGGG